MAPPPATDTMSLVRPRFLRPYSSSSSLSSSCRIFRLRYVLLAGAALVLAERWPPTGTYRADAYGLSDRRNFVAGSASAAAGGAAGLGGAFPLLPPAVADTLLPNIGGVKGGGGGAAATAASSASTSPSSPISLPPIGLGAWAWGDSLFWGYDRKNDSDLRQVFDYAVSKKLAFFDTAELYGLGRSETLLGQFRSDLVCGTGAKADREPLMSTRDKDEDENVDDGVQIATKFSALPFRTKASDVVKACEASLGRLAGGISSCNGSASGSRFRPRPIDLYQIHFPNAWSNAEYWEGIAECYHRGLVKAVGVSNYGIDATRAAHAALAKRGVPLTSNQIQCSLLYRYPVANGLLDACRDLNVQVLSYSPLALGFLTNKYIDGHTALPDGPRRKIGEKLLMSGSGYLDLLNVMRTVASRHQHNGDGSGGGGGSTMDGDENGGDAVPPLSQVALNWAIAKGTIPIPGARTLRQAKQNLESLNWSLTEDEVSLLDEASSKVTGFLAPETSPFPKKDINTNLVMFDS